MNKKFIKENNFKNWYKEVDNTNYIILSDDIDSLISTYILNKLFNTKIKMFFSFSKLYLREDVNINELKKGMGIGIDIDMSNNKCFGNHVTYIQNKNCISLNKFITYNNNKYYDKFAGSTLLTIISIYNVDLSNMTNEQLEVLICIDTAFKQFFFNKELFTYYYKDVLEYPVFIEVVSKHSKSYFYDIIKKYKLHEKIYINEDGYMETKIKLDELSQLFNINLSLPKQKFQKIYSFQNVGMNIHKFKREVDKNKIFSNAVTNKNFIKASVRY